MQKFRSFLFVCLLPALVLISCYQPRAKVINCRGLDSIFNAGKLNAANTFKHTFFIKNTGENDLKIDSVVASCDCINLSWQKALINPGKTGFIIVSVKPNIKYKDKGNVTRSVIVKTNMANHLTVFQISYSL